MRPPSHHSIFFSSLKQVEKRMKLENPSQPSTLSSTPPPPPPPPPPPLGETNYTPIESLSSPIYLNFDQPNGNSGNSSNSSSLQDSEAPREFLSNSLDFPPTHEDPPPPETIHDPQTINRVEINGVDEIELLIQLLGLSDCEEEEEQNKVGFDLKNYGETCGYECGFYAKMVGVKGPKCEREVGRLEGWIKHFLNDGEERRKEPLRLAHLLLGKAAFLSKCSDDFGRFEFPSTIEEFLQNDPPKD